MRRFWIISWLSFWCGLAGWAQPALPPAPEKYVYDRANLLTPDTRTQLSQRLDAFERESSAQVVVWIEPKLPPGTTLEEYVNRAFQEWKIGQKGKDNGVLLAVFPEDRKMRIEVGYGLEGALPDALAGRIIEQEIGPAFRQREFDQGVTAGVEAILAATRGEYRGTGRTQFTRAQQGVSGAGALVGGVLGFILGAGVRRFQVRRESALNQVSQGLLGGFIGGVGHSIALALLVQRLVIPAGAAFIFTWIFILMRQRGDELSRTGRHRRYSQSWPNWNASGWSGSGSGFGGFGGGGGFRGGGGRSGGGGASGGW